MSLLKRMLKIIDDTVVILESEGGFQIPSLITLYQRLQVCHYVQLLTCPDSCVHNIVEAKLCKEDTAIRMRSSQICSWSQEQFMWGPIYLQETNN